MTLLPETVVVLDVVLQVHPEFDAVDLGARADDIHFPPLAFTFASSSKCTLMMQKLLAASASGTLRKVFCVGTVAIVIPAACIRWQCRCRIVFCIVPFLLTGPANKCIV